MSADELSEYREVYPRGAIDDRVFLAFIEAGQEPPAQDRINRFGFSAAEAKLLDAIRITPREELGD